MSACCNCTLYLASSIVAEQLPLNSYEKRILRFYQQVKAYQLLLLEPHPLQDPCPSIPNLTATLLGYQVSALRWMMEREEGPEGKMDGLHMLWREIPVAPVMEGAERQCVYYNPFTGK